VILPLPGRPGNVATIGAEKAMLTAMVDYQRAVVFRKVGGLDDDDLRRVMTPTGLTLIGLVKHLAYVERYWFQTVFSGREVTYPWSDADPDADWRPEPGESAAEIVALYVQEAAVSREIAAAADLEDLSSHPSVKASLRWILLHMLEELARHLGHADIMREAIDGATGD